MTDENVTPVEDKTTQTPPVTDEGKPSGAVNFYKEEAAKYREQANQLKEDQDQMQKKLNEMEEAGLRESKNYEELWTKEKAMREESEDKLRNFQAGFLTDKKLTAIETEAMKAGIDPNYVDFVKKENSSFVKVETTSEGNVNVLGAKEYVEDFKAKFPAMFKGNAGPNINSASPSQPTGPQEFTPAQLLKMSREKPAEYKKYMAKKFNMN